MSNSKPSLRPIAPKPQELVQNPGVIAVVTFPPPEIQEITVPTTNTSTTVTTTKVSKKNNGQKVDSHEEETGWDRTPNISHTTHIRVCVEFIC